MQQAPQYWHRARIGMNAVFLIRRRRARRGIDLVDDLGRGAPGKSVVAPYPRAGHRLPSWWSVHTSAPASSPLSALPAPPERAHV